MPPYDPWSDPLYDTAPDHLKPLDEREDDFGFFDFAKDVVAAPFRGVAGAVEGIAELGNVFGMDYDVPENLGLGTSETVVGGLLEGITEFGTAFIPVAGWVGRGAKIAGTAGKSGKAVKLAGGLEKAAKGKGAKGWLARRGQEATAGFVADFAVMQGHEARLSDMLQQYGGLSDPITEFLKSDPDDPEVVGRLKAAVEGLGAGVVFDSLLLGARAIFKGRKAFDDAMTKGSTKEEAAVDYNKAVDAEAEAKLSADLEEPEDLLGQAEATSDFTVQSALDEEGEVVGLFDEQARSLAKEVDLGVTSDRDLADVILDNDGKVVGARWSAFDTSSENYTFDVTIDPKHQGQGLGTKLIDAGIEGFDEFADAFPDATMKLHVTSDISEEALKRRGFTAVSQKPLIMERLEGAPAVPKDPQAPRGPGDRSKPEPEAKILDRSDPKLSEVEAEYQANLKAWEEGKFAVSDFPHYNVRGMGEDAGSVVRALDSVFDESFKAGDPRISDKDFMDTVDAVADLSGESVETIVKQIRKATSDQREVARAAHRWHFVLKSFAESELRPALDNFANNRNDIENMARLLDALDDTLAIQAANKGLGAATSQALRSRRYFGEIPEEQPKPKKSVTEQDQADIDRLKQQSLDERIEAMGGIEAVKKRAEGILDAVESGGIGGGMKAAKKFQHNKWLAMYNEGFISAILSSPVTLMTNFVGPVLTSLYRPLEGAVGASLRGDSEAASDFMSEFSYVTSEFTKLLFGWGDAARVAKKSWDEDRLLLDASAGSGTMDLPGQQQRAITAANVGFTDESAAGTATNWLGTIVRLSGRALSATDSAVKTLNYRAVVMADLAKQGRKQNKSGAELAKWIESQMDGMLVDDLALTLPNLEAAAKQRGLRGSAKDKFVTDALKDREVQGRSALAARALEISRDVTQTRELKKGEARFRELGRSTQKLVNNHPALRPFITFVRTPVNLLSWTGERTVDPALNGARILAGQLRGVPADKTIKDLSDKLGNRSRFIADLASGDPKRAAEAHGRFVAGLGFTITATALAAEGGITGGGPKDIQQRKLWEQAGWQPYSIKIGDEYFSYRRFDPFATILGVVGDMVEVNQYAPEELQNTSENLGLEVGVALARNLGSKTYLTGLMDLTGLMQDPERYAGKMFRKAGGAVVPLSGFTRSFTSTLGDDQSFREIHGVMDQIKSQIPGLSDSLMPVRNFMGEAIEKHQAWGGRATDWFLPIMHSTTTSDPINLEVKNLGHAFGPPSPTRYNLDLKALADSSGQTAYDRWMELHGEVRIKGRSLKQTLTRLINSRNYQRMSPGSFGDEGSPRVSEINKVIRKFRSKAETEMMQEFPEVRTARQNRAIIQRAQHRGTSPEAIRASLFPL